MIQDYDDGPIGLHDQVALYAGAEMNFFVTNGPGMLCTFTEYPLMQFDLNISPIGMGIPYGQGFPWLLPNQFQIHEPDDLPVIRKHFYKWANR